LPPVQAFHSSLDAWTRFPMVGMAGLRDISERSWLAELLSMGLTWVWIRSSMELVSERLSTNSKDELRSLVGDGVESETDSLASVLNEQRGASQERKR
jgi:hypothetical protein